MPYWEIKYSLEVENFNFLEFFILAPIILKILFFQEKIPGMYFFIGGAKKGTDPTKAAPHHTPDFYVDDSAMITGLKSMTTLALDYLTNNK